METAVPQQLRTVNEAVHQDIPVHIQRLDDFIPGEDPVFRKWTYIPHDPLFSCPCFFIDKVGNEGIQRRRAGYRFLEDLDGSRQGFPVQPVIAVADFEVNSFGSRQRRVDRASVSLVLLMDRAHLSGMFFFILLCDFKGIVLRGTVIDNQDFNILSADQGKINRLFHVGGWIVTWNRNRQNLHFPVLTLLLTVSFFSPAALSSMILR